MKDLQRLTLLIIFLLACFNSKKPNKADFSGYFYLKQLYNGPDVIAGLQNARIKTTLKYFTLNRSVLYFSNSDAEKNNILGSIKLKKIINNRLDNIDTGKCCVNIEKRTFPSAKGGSSNENPIMNIYKANNCLEIKAQDLAYWRLCTDKQNVISQLHLKLIYNILKTNKKKDKNMLSKTNLI